MLALFWTNYVNLLCDVTPLKNFYKHDFSNVIFIFAVFETLHMFVGYF